MTQTIFISQIGASGAGRQLAAPDLRVNAIFYAAKIITFIETLAQRLKSSADPQNGFSPPYTTVDLEMIEGGTAQNIIPAKCSFSWGFRNIPGDDPEQFAKEVFDFIDAEILLVKLLRGIHIAEHATHQQRGSEHVAD